MRVTKRALTLSTIRNSTSAVNGDGLMTSSSGFYSKIAGPNSTARLDTVLTTLG